MMTPLPPFSCLATTMHFGSLVTAALCFVFSLPMIHHHIFSPCSQKYVDKVRRQLKEELKKEVI